QHRIIHQPVAVGDHAGCHPRLQGVAHKPPRRGSGRRLWLVRRTRDEIVWSHAPLGSGGCCDLRTGSPRPASASPAFRVLGVVNLHRDRLLNRFRAVQEGSTDAAAVSSSGSGGFAPLPGTCSPPPFAGTPAPTHRSGIAPRPTGPAATTTLPPMTAPGSTMTPAPSQLPGPMDTAVLLG